MVSCKTWESPPARILLDHSNCLSVLAVECGSANHVCVQSKLHK